MKKSDIAMIILIASASALIAYFVASSVFGGFSQESVKVKTIDPISSTIVEPSTTIFNKNAINPVIKSQITTTTNTGSQ